VRTRLTGRGLTGRERCGEPASVAGAVRPRGPRISERGPGNRGPVAGRLGVAALGQQLLDGEGGVNRFVNVFLNDTDVRHLDGLDTAVDERDSVVLLPAMAGGC